MFEGLRFRVVLLSVAIGYVTALVFVCWLQSSFFGDVPAAERGGSNTVPWLLVHVLGPFVTGYVAARLASSRAQLHATFAALICWLIAAWLGSGIIAGIIYVSASLAGSHVYAKLRA
jgi:hypothetical protein